MTLEEYAAQQAVISSALANYVMRWAKFFANPALSVAEWLRFLELLWPEVQRRYEESAALARTFYDAQRALHHPELDPNERLLSELRFEWFVQNMEPARVKFSQEEAGDAGVAQVALRAVREVEMAGRRQIIGAVKDDPAPRIIRGWARVATGRETCAWCLMLISRGPVYLGATNAGLDLDDDSAAEMIAAGEDVSEYMEQWHAGCDCKVVPVFKVDDWPGLEAQKRALRLWIDAGREASRLIESGKARTNNMNKETQNALRRRLERGEVRMSEFAAAAA
ncbi:capsid maturation protease [Mycobacterium phage SoYo]|uniref:Capsid maturation protease n=45 Tax=Microwolfvirus TaxID=2942894 RepID=A0A345L1C3_9CAUD|nr:head maturation protease [Mycobacterium phage Bxz2]YP_008126253.1 head maturation protease [Mycobacterium phage Jobu08]YP_009195113.1 head maturation protease [Mycobacterium phage Tiffany]YP_009198440.1 head maturation protease [Mycobacterium phage MarQuardt]YP_009219076.1 head maturation protease [Mycobacterium phage Anubis]YP_009617261.1 head maturation protease [Mycobacterium phage Wonder]YP_009635605.1 head maturation protease [Mycobacterium phage JHC117]YP_009635690.1 head maturation